MAWVVAACCGATHANPAVVPPIPPPPDATIAPPTPVPPPKSPIDLFRDLLAMSPAERSRVLTNRPPEIQQRLLRKVREYEALKENERELRLQSTELSYYLLPLMETPGTNRPSQLTLIPERMRPLVEERLAAWDQLPPASQRALLETEAAVRYFNEMSGASEQQKQDKLASIPPAGREKLQSNLSKWHSLSDSERTQVWRRFKEFFELTPREQESALRTLSETERRQIESTLKTFGELPPAQRNACIRALQKYADLTAGERQQFLKNAERWRAMTPEQRKAWRDLVAKLSLVPPLPSGVGPSFPPKPPTNRRPLVTNGN